MTGPRGTGDRAASRPTTVLFVVYLVVLAWIVLWKLEVPHVGGGAVRTIKLVPFAASGGDGASAPLEVVANLVLFVPFGLYLGLLARSWRWRAVGVIAGASLVLEVTQYVLAIGSSDLTDLGVNAAGGLAGRGLLAVARRLLRARTATVMTRICVVGTVSALLGVGVLVAAPLRHAAPRDVPVLCPPTVPVPAAGDGARPRLDRAACG